MKTEVFNHDSSPIFWVQKRSGQYMTRTISQTCSENSWGTSFHNIYGAEPRPCISHVSMWFSELAIMWFSHAWMVDWIGWVVWCQITIGTSVRSAGCWCMILCAIGRGNTWWEPFHRPVPRTLEEHHFITSKGLSLDLHVTCIRVVSWTCHHAIFHMLEW